MTRQIVTRQNVTKQIVTRQNVAETTQNYNNGILDIATHSRRNSLIRESSLKTHSKGFRSFSKAQYSRTQKLLISFRWEDFI